MSLPESLERAATQLAELADHIRPANGDPHRLLEELDASQAGTLLRWILSHEAGAAEELVGAWSEDEAGASALLGVSEEGLAKAGRKLLRRAHHKLRSRGVKVESSQPKGAAEPRRVLGADDRWQAAHLSAPDFRGTRMGYLAEPHPSGGARLFEIRFDAGRGVLDFKVYNAGRSKVRGFLRSLTAGNAQRLFEVDRTALCALVRRASLAQPADRPLPTAFVEWRGRLFPESLADEATPGTLARSALGGSTAPADALSSAIAEIDAGRLGPWPPPTAWVGDWMQKGREAVEGLEGEARAVAIDTWLDGVTVALAEEASRELITHHLEEMAWVHWQTEKGQTEKGQTEKGQAEKGQAENAELARGLLAAAEVIAGDPAEWTRLSRARVEALFAPLLTELRVVEESPLADSDDQG